MKFGIRGQNKITDVIKCVKFLVDRFRGSDTPKLPFPIDLLRRPYNSVALLCDTVMMHDGRQFGVKVTGTQD